MSWHPALEAAAEAAAHRISPVHLRQLADRLGAGASDEVVAEAVPVPGFAEAVLPLLAARRAAGVPAVEAAAYLRGLAAGREQGAAAVQLESVWSGPKTHPVPVRSTAQVLVGLVGEAQHELLLMTYSARDHPPLRAALAAALGRGVAVTIVVETLQGAAGALVGQEPAAAFTGLDGLQLWHWPIDKRGEEYARMHAKIAVADRRLLLVSSANLTQSGVDRNIEAGLLVRGGTAPQRAAEHIAELRSRGVLARLAS
ncbi:DISARM system phospholipase D-like protein DrmC [Actinoplanes sp. KI2]|uniref:DISARM system phospholipase D-like protein DrmC n=1 Tax=Actinoplanes sp. KI2 TaxID=2983315 RepID=UPI0021D5942C|nr:DISARM system phospholipase D-like protein DrmC [Actinoplanes sp. KI2]MCU7729632.1 DISARM system phospholipase D-like protein DrmC [Actinoplanes sp. KI2]